VVLGFSASLEKRLLYRLARYIRALEDTGGCCPLSELRQPKVRSKGISSLNAFEVNIYIVAQCNFCDDNKWTKGGGLFLPLLL